MLLFQVNVRISYFDHQLAEILKHSSVWSLRTRKDVVVFSIEDLTHSQGSLHPFSLAVDLDVAGNALKDLQDLYAWLRRYMPAGYDVIFEGNHVHVEYDTHRADALARA